MRNHQKKHKKKRKNVSVQGNIAKRVLEKTEIFVEQDARIKIWEF
jgi:hypothetical protein